MVEESLKHEAAGEAIKGTVALAGTAASLVTLQEWVAVVTIIFVVLQIIYLLCKFWMLKDRRKAEEE